jgi:hypothetical protein
MHAVTFQYQVGIVESRIGDAVEITKNTIDPNVIFRRGAGDGAVCRNRAGFTLFLWLPISIAHIGGQNLDNTHSTASRNREYRLAETLDDKGPQRPEADRRISIDGSKNPMFSGNGTKLSQWEWFADRTRIGTAQRMEGAMMTAISPPHRVSCGLRSGQPAAPGRQGTAGRANP